MKTTACVAFVTFTLIGVFSGGAAAASFDCAKAASPFEYAICDNPAVSQADDRLAKTYATAIGGLSAAALEDVRGDQRRWLDFAQRACTADAKPLTSGSYSTDGAACLASTFDGRSAALETSRMIDGHRFYPMSRYEAFADPDGVGVADYNWPVATHEFFYPQLDAEDAAAGAFNAFVVGQVDALSGSPTGEVGEGDDTSDTSNSITVKELAGAKRITLDVETYWYGHGAAHGNDTISFLHYLVDQQRAMEGTDLFAGEGWQKALMSLAVEALKAEHGDNLMLDDPKDLADVVVDPTRWDLSDAYGLVIQFEPYEVSSYAYGAPTARVPWTALEDYLAAGSEGIRYGY